KYLSYAVQDWQIGTLLTYSSGRPIPAPNASATPALSSQLFQPTVANRVAGQPLFVDATGAPLDINCHCFDPNKTFVLNPKAWANPAVGQFGSAAGFYADYRYQRHPSESINFGR